MVFSWLFRVDDYLRKRLDERDDILGSLFYALMLDTYNAARDASIERFKKRFPNVTASLGFADGPLEETMMDEVIYVLDKKDVNRYGRPEKVDVLFRKYDENSIPLADCLNRGYSLEDALKIEDGNFINIGGHVVEGSLTDFWDRDFDYTGAERKLQEYELQFLQRSREEIIKDELRLKFSLAKKLGSVGDKEIYVVDPKKMPIQQVGYFWTQSKMVKIFDSVYNRVVKKLVGRLPRGGSETESRVVDIYKQATDVLNRYLRLPGEVNLVYKIEL